MTDGDRSALVERLAAAPGWFSHASAAATAAVSPATDGQWIVADVLHHVRAADAILSTRIYHMLVRDATPLPAFDEVAWGRLFATSGVSLADQAAHFALRRVELVAVLRTIASAEWLRAGQHESLGALTVADIALGVASHEAEHRIQIEEILAAK